MTLWCNFQQFFWHHGHILPSGVWGVGKLIVITQHLHLQQLRNHVLTCIKSATGINKFSVEREQWKREGYKSLILLPVSIYIYIYIYIYTYFLFIYLYIYIYTYFLFIYLYIYTYFLFIYLYIYIYIYTTADSTVSAFWASSVQCWY